MSLCRKCLECTNSILCNYTNTRKKLDIFKLWIKKALKGFLNRDLPFDRRAWALFWVKICVYNNWRDLQVMALISQWPSRCSLLRHRTNGRSEFQLNLIVKPEKQKLDGILTSTLQDTIELCLVEQLWVLGPYRFLQKKGEQSCCGTEWKLVLQAVCLWTNSSHLN